jgi:hypothetical protein
MQRSVPLKKAFVFAITPPSVKLTPGKTFSVSCPGEGDAAYAEGVEQGTAETQGKVRRWTQRLFLVPEWFVDRSAVISCCVVHYIFFLTVKSHTLPPRATPPPKQMQPRATLPDKSKPQR